jgi:hypothetical protein
MGRINAGGQLPLARIGIPMPEFQKFFAIHAAAARIGLWTKNCLGFRVMIPLVDCCQPVAIRGDLNEFDVWSSDFRSLGSGIKNGNICPGKRLAGDVVAGAYIKGLQ